MSVFRIERIRSVDQFTPRHRHAYCELRYCDTGATRLHLDDTTVLLGEHQLVLIPAGTDHATENVGAFSQYVCGAPYTPGVVPVNRPISDLPNLEMRRLFTMMYELYRQTEIIHADTLFNRFIDLVCELSTDARAAACGHPAVRALLEKLHANFANPDFDLRAAATSLRLSEDRLRALFKEATGLSPQEYLSALRVRQACHLLSSGRPISVKEAALDSGFSDPLYFSRFFRRQTGTTPSEFRRASAEPLMDENEQEKKRV